MEQNVIDKILKCLSMADSATYNEHEAANAMRAAQRLARQHGLDLADLEATRQQTTADKVKYETTEEALPERQLYPWEKLLLHCLDKLFDVRHYFSGSSRTTWKVGTVFFGVAQDVALAKAAFSVLRNTGLRFASKEYGSKWSPDRTSFLMGFSDGIWSQVLINKKTTTTSDSRALVLVNKEEQVKQAFAERTSGMRNSKGSGSSIQNAEAYHSGRAVGSTTSLNFNKAVQA